MRRLRGKSKQRDRTNRKTGAAATYSVEIVYVINICSDLNN
jgi:hypothetical protein